MIVLAILLLLSPAILAKDYIEVWPEGWSEVIPLFKTSIFADRFFVTHDPHGVSFLSVDGVYFKELDLTYRLVQDFEVIEEVVLRRQGEIGSSFLGVDEEGGRHVLWLERSPSGNTISYTNFGVPYDGHESVILVQTGNTIQDLAAFQDGGVTHMVWSERDRYFQIRYAQVKDGGVIFLETVTNTADVSVRPSITVDERGVVHLAWMETTQVGVDISYSNRRESGWSVSRRLGEGSVQDIQQGGSIAMAGFGEDVYMAWSALPRNSSRLSIFLTKVNAQGRLETPAFVAAGSRPKFVSGSKEPELVWQGSGTFGAQVNYFDQGSSITNLTVGRKGAFRPEAYYKNGFRYVYWLQAEADGSYFVYGIDNENPKAMSLWRKIGIDERAPLSHVFFLFMSTFMLAAVYAVTNLGVMAVVGFIYALLQKFLAYQKQGLFYQVALLGTLLMVVRRLPIPAVHPQFFGLVHHGLSYALATLGTFVILRKARQGGLFLTLGMLIIWMFLFQFFALIPQTILR